MPLTVDQVTAMAPDAAAAKNGRGQAVERKWPRFGRHGEALWGLCQGSGAEPYQVRVDLAGPAFKCSCPSFKLPCKHSLGLLFLYAEKPHLFAAEQSCDFLDEWLAARRQRAEQKEQKRVEKEADSPPDPETLARRQAAQTKRAGAREDKVAAGISELSLFLHDLTRQGLANLAGQPFSFWDGMATRLVDAQAPGLARRVADLGSVSRSGAGWQERFLHHLAPLQLACDVWPRRNTLPAPLLADLRAVAGFSTPQEDVLAATGTAADWFVLALAVSEEDRLRLARTWYWDAAGRRAAVVHQYAYAGQPLQIRHAPGCGVRTELVFFPSAAPWRALVKDGVPSGDFPFSQPAGLPGLDAMLADFAATLAANPWTDRRAYLLDRVHPVSRDGRWFLQDVSAGGGDAATRRTLPLHAPGHAGWKLLSLGGGHPLAVFGEWDGAVFVPLSAFDRKERLCSLAGSTAEERP